MSDDEWVKERAKEIAIQFGRPDNVVDLQNAILVALHTAAGKYSYNLDAFEHGRQSILDRLKEPDEAMVEAVAKALWRLECSRADADERRDGRTPPVQWADPWHESGCGILQQRPYKEGARASIRALALALEQAASEEIVRDAIKRSYGADPRPVRPIDYREPERVSHDRSSHDEHDDDEPF